jgi:predicted dehydrogenase
MTKFLIAGFGSIGRRHFRNLLALGEQDILFYRTGKSTLSDDELKGYIVETDIHKALLHRPDAVIVANPTAAHLDIAIPAAEAGCHLLMEKPISHDAAQIPALEAALQKGGGKVLVGYQFRFHPVLRQVKAMLNSGALGKPLSARAHWGEYLPDWHPWEDYRSSYSARSDLGGGVILTLSHPLDYLRWYFGDVESLWAFAGKVSPLELDVEDFAEIGLQFKNGMHASLHLDYFQRPGTHRIQIIGTEGTLEWDNLDGTARFYQAETRNWQVISPPDDFDRNMLFLDEMRHFLEVIALRTELVCCLQDGKAVLSLAQAAQKSAQDQQIVYL